MKVRTEELEGTALDWATFCARFEGLTPSIKTFEPQRIQLVPGAPEIETSGHQYIYYVGAYNIEVRWSPVGDWQDTGRLIDRFGVWLSDDACEEWNGPWIGSVRGGHMQCGGTAQIAACRAIVAAKLGDEVDVPDELLRKGEGKA